jgi:hypothetical protein
MARCSHRDRAAAFISVATSAGLVVSAVTTKVLSVEVTAHRTTDDLVSQGRREMRIKKAMRELSLRQ